MAIINISNEENTITKKIFTELSLESLQNILNNSNFKEKTLIIKLGATWCNPCKKIKDLCNKCFLDMPENILCFDIDIDQNIEIFNAFKSKKMIKGVPSILLYNCKKSRPAWYVCDGCLTGSDEKRILEFFKQIKSNLVQI